ncbi:MAG: ComF family protein [Caldilineae bacterium]|nr:MAG: ComF family protein [Caldilineae bacterium]
MKLAALFRDLADLIFPPRCVYCQAVGSHFCRACRREARFVGDSICVRCGQPATTRCTCYRCRHEPAQALLGMRGAVFYGGPLAFAIHAFKYRGITELARPLAGYLIAYLQAHALPFDYLVPVPLHPQREKFRGYNQSLLLAEEVAASCHIPVRSDVIRRIRHTPPQVHLRRRERLLNMQGAFAPVQAGILHGETVLLIDDVCTTGATLRAAAEALRQAGAGDIWGLTIARARPRIELQPWQKGLSATDVFLIWDGNRSRYLIGAPPDAAAIPPDPP